MVEVEAEPTELMAQCVDLIKQVDGVMLVDPTTKASLAVEELSLQQSHPADRGGLLGWR
jgi:hypothetical protein